MRHTAHGSHLKTKTVTKTHWTHGFHTATRQNDKMADI